MVSCNTTAVCRVLHSLDREIGVEKAWISIVRRAADPAEERGGIDMFVPEIGNSAFSHHAADVKTVLKGVNVVTTAVKAPVTHFHYHMFFVKTRRKTTREEIVEALERSPRIILLRKRQGVRSTGDLFNYIRERRLGFGDMYEVGVWEESIGVLGDEVYMGVVVHQEAIVVPENVDAVRACLKLSSKEESLKKTDESLGIASSPTWGYSQLPGIRELSRSPRV